MFFSDSPSLDLLACIQTSFSDKITIKVFIDVCLLPAKTRHCCPRAWSKWQQCFFPIHLHCLNLKRHFALKRESVLCTLRTVSQIILLMNNCYQWRKQRWGNCDCFEKKGPCKNANKSAKVENLVFKYFIREWDENKLLQNTGLDLIK